MEGEENGRIIGRHLTRRLRTTDYSLYQRVQQRHVHLTIRARDSAELQKARNM